MPLLGHRRAGNIEPSAIVRNFHEEVVRFEYQTYVDPCCQRMLESIGHGFL